MAATPAPSTSPQCLLPERQPGREEELGEEKKTGKMKENDKQSQISAFMLDNKRFDALATFFFFKKTEEVNHIQNSICKVEKSTEY